MVEKGTRILGKPYIRNPVRTEQAMLMVLISLLPASVFGVWRFGWKALGLLLLSAGVCILTEFLYEKFRGQPITVGDCSAAVTGLLLALGLPVSVPWWLPAVGGIFAILAAKQLFGGLGRNILNPALAARLLLQILFSGFLEDGAAAAIGEASVLALIIGAMLLIWFDIITLRIPGAYIGCYLAVLLIFGGRGADLSYLAVNLFSGGVVLGAFFMATDYVTSPLTKSGRLLYGCVIGILTGIFRLAGSFAAGVACAVLIGNLLAPLIDRLTVPVPFGRSADCQSLGACSNLEKVWSPRQRTRRKKHRPGSGKPAKERKRRQRKRWSRPQSQVRETHRNPWKHPSKSRRRKRRRKRNRQPGKRKKREGPRRHRTGNRKKRLQRNPLKQRRRSREKTKEKKSRQKKRR